MDLSLIIPCFRESSHIKQSVKKLIETLNTTTYSYEIIFVDDGSPDQTPTLLKDLCENSPNLRLICHSKNIGRGGAFKTGVKEAKSDIVGFIDIDLEIEAHYIAPILSLIKNQNFDIVTGLRHYVYSQTQSLFRHILSSCYRIISRSLLGAPLLDTETGCKFFNRKRCQSVIFESENNGWFWDTEVLVRSYYKGLRIKEMPVLFLRNHEIMSTVRVLPDSIRYLRDLFQFRKRVGFRYLDRSFIYWHPCNYNIMMKIFRKKRKEIFTAMASHIENGSSVVDLCSGDGQFFLSNLKEKGCSYIGLESNIHFVKNAKEQSNDVRLANVLLTPFPQADYVVMVSSLYHFFDNVHEIIDKMVRSSKKAVLISEPVSNFSNSSISWIKALARYLSNPGIGKYQKRFDEKEFKKVMEKYNPRYYQDPKNPHQRIAHIATPRE